MRRGRRAHPYSDGARAHGGVPCEGAGGHLGGVGNPAHILVVDDDPDLRKSLAEVLQDVGYEVSCARNGEEALRALDGEVPSAILLDLTMPIMDGWTFRERQQGDPRIAQIPTVVITASFSDARRAESLHADAFLPKPFEVSSLTETLQRLCGSPAGAPAPRPAAAAAPEAPAGPAAGTPPRR